MPRPFIPEQDVIFSSPLQAGVATRRAAAFLCGLDTCMKLYAHYLRLLYDLLTERDVPMRRYGLSTAPLQPNVPLSVGTMNSHA